MGLSFKHPVTLNHDQPATTTLLFRVMKFNHIFIHIADISPHYYIAVKLTALQMKAYNYYKKNCMSIEIVKEDELQKVNFRVKSKVRTFYVVTL